jgi:hypothetical protein
VNEHRLAHLEVFLSSFALVIPRFVESVLMSSPFGESLPSDDELAASALSAAADDEAKTAFTRHRSNTLKYPHTAHAPPHTHTHTHSTTLSHRSCGALRSDSLCILSTHQRRYLTRKLAEYLKEHCATNLEQVRTCRRRHQFGPWHDAKPRSSGNDVACARVAHLRLHPQAGT